MKLNKFIEQLPAPEQEAIQKRVGELTGAKVEAAVKTVDDLPYDADEYELRWVGNPLITEDGGIHPHPGNLYQYIDGKWLPLVADNREEWCSCC